MKKLYDRVMKAQAERNRIASEIVRLNEEDKFDEALALQPKLEAANSEYEDANRLYLTTLAATNNGGDPAQRFVPMGSQAEPQEIQDLRRSPQYMQQWLQAFRNGVTPRTIKEGQ